MGRPQVPDLAAAAAQQGTINRNAALDVAQQNRYSQFGPEGSSNVWGTDANGNTTNTTTMGERPQAMYNALMDNGQSNLASFQQQYWGAGAPQGGGGGGISVNIPGAGGRLPGGIQKDLDYSNLTAMPTTDPAAARQQAQDALYKMNTQYLDPQWQQSQSALETRLSNQGLVPGSTAYNRALANENDAQQKAYESARQGAIAGGGAEAERAQNMALALRNQGVTEAGNLGAFHNAAQDQGAQQFLKKYGYDTGLQGQLGAAEISAGASTQNAQNANDLAVRQEAYKEATGMGAQAQAFLPQFGISQGNVGTYKPEDVYGATQQQYQDELARYSAKKPGLLQQALPIVGSVAGVAAGKLLGK